MLEDVLAKLNKVRADGPSKYRAQCPAHGDAQSGRTLSIKDAGGGRTLLHCHAGCHVNDITMAIGLGIKDLYPADHTYERSPVDRKRLNYARALHAVAASDIERGVRLSAQDKAKAIEAAMIIAEAKRLGVR